MKALHELGAIGMMGSMAAYLVLVATAPTDSLEGYASVRRGIDFVCRWILVPSLLVTLVSGLLSIAFTEAYKNAGWAWFKAALGIIMFEGTLLTIQASATRAADRGARTDPAHRVEQPLADARAVLREHRARCLAAAVQPPSQRRVARRRYGMTRSATRRLSRRPASVAFDAIGCDSP